MSHVPYRTATGVGTIPEATLHPDATIEAAALDNRVYYTDTDDPDNNISEVMDGDWIWIAADEELRQIDVVQRNRGYFYMKAPFTNAITAGSDLYYIKQGELIEVSVRNTTPTAGTINGATFTEDDTFTQRAKDDRVGLEPYRYNTNGSSYRILEYR